MDNKPYTWAERRALPEPHANHWHGPDGQREGFASQMPVSPSASPDADRPTDNYDLEAGGVKFDAGKVRMDLVPWDAIYAEAAVYTYGAIKYNDWNWAQGMRKGRIVAALMRHIGWYMVGQELDDESGLPHTWHMRCCTGMLVAGELRGVAMEDREAAQEGYAAAHDLFKGMRDPADTVKNGGGSTF